MKEQLRDLIIQNLLTEDIKGVWGYYILIKAQSKTEQKTEQLLKELFEQIQTDQPSNYPGMIDILGEKNCIAFQEYFKH